MSYLKEVTKIINEETNNIIFYTNPSKYGEPTQPTPHEIVLLFKMGYVYKISKRTLWDNTRVDMSEIFPSDSIVDRIVAEYYKALKRKAEIFHINISVPDLKILNQCAFAMSKVYGIRMLLKPSGCQIAVYINEELLK